MKVIESVTAIFLFNLGEKVKNQLKYTMNQSSQIPILNSSTTNPTVPVSPERNITNDEVFRAVKIILACLIIVTNLLVLFIFQRKKRVLLKSPVNNILCSFSINEATAGVSIFFHVIPFYIVDYQKYRKVLTAAYILSKLCLLSSVGHLVLLSCDRLLAVVSPLKHQIKFTKKCAIMCLLFAWTIAIALPLLEYLLYSIINLKIYTVVIMLCFVLVPLVILLCQYIITFLFIRKNVRQSRQRSFRHKANCKKAFVLQLIMFLSFFICAAPFVSIRIILAYNKKLFVRMPAYLSDIFFLLRFLTSFTNPLIFTLYKTDIQNAIKVVFSRKRKSRGELEITLLERLSSYRRSSSCSNDNKIDKPV